MHGEQGRLPEVKKMHIEVQVPEIVQFGRLHEIERAALDQALLKTEDPSNNNEKLHVGAAFLFSDGTIIPQSNNATQHAEARAVIASNTRFPSLHEAPAVLTIALAARFPDGVAVMQDVEPLPDGATPELLPSHTPLLCGDCWRSIQKMLQSHPNQEGINPTILIMLENGEVLKTDFKTLMPLPFKGVNRGAKAYERRLKHLDGH